MYTNSFQGRYNPYSVPSNSSNDLKYNYNPYNFIPPNTSNSSNQYIQQVNQNINPFKKYSSNPIQSLNYALEGNYVKSRSDSQPYARPGDMFNALQYLDGRSQNVASLYANNANLQSMWEAVLNDQRVLYPLSVLLKLKDYSSASGFWDVVKNFLNLSWWILEGTLDQKKTSYKQGLISMLQQFGVSGGRGVSESEFKTFMSQMYRDAAITMGYTRVEVFENSMLKYINSIIALGVSFNDLMVILANLCSSIGSMSVAVTYSILEAFFKILIASKSTKVLDVFHTFMTELIGLGSNNSSNEMIGAVKTTRSIFYDAFKTLQKNVNIQNDSPYYLTDDGYILMKSMSTDKMPTYEEREKAIEQGETDPTLVEQTRDMGQIKVVV